MSKMSFLEKIDILFKMSKTSYIYLLVVFILIVLGIIFSTTNKRTVNRNKKIYLGISIFTLVSMLLIFHTPLSKIFDYMMNNLFIAIYFPNLAIYLAALIITNIIVWISIFNFKTSDSIRKLNTIIYVLMNYLLFLILSIIKKNNLDVFTQNSVYSNKKATALIELSSLIFVVWIIFLITYKIILIYLKKDYKPKVKKVIVKKEVKQLPENYEPKETPSRLYGRLPKEKEKIITIKEIEQVKAYEDSLTLADYKLLSKLLKQKKYSLEIEEENSKVNTFSQEELEYREKQKQEIIRLEEERKELLRQERLKLEKAKQELEDKELEQNLTELDRLFKGIR